MNVVDLEKFHGRKSIFELIKKRISDFKEGYRQNIAFLGERYVGKSIILQKLIADLDDDELVPVYLDLENKDLNYFYHRVVGSLLCGFSRIRNLPCHDDISLLIQSTREHLPKTSNGIKKIQSHIHHHRTLEAYREIIALPQVFATETNLMCILLMDEFHTLEELGLPEIFKEFGKKVMTQTRCLYIVTSSLPAAAKKILSERLSLLFGNFEVVQIEPFDFSSSQEFIHFYLKDISVDESLTKFLFDFTGGQPLYLRFICQELVNLSAIHRQNKVFAPLASQAIENILFNSWGVLSRHFELMLERISAGKGNFLMASILMALSQRKQKAKELTQAIGIKQATLTPKINRLVEKGIVVKNGSFFYVKDKMLRYWIKYVFQKRRISIDLTPERQTMQFREELQQAMDRFDTILKKDFSSRIAELFCCFEEETLYVNNRRYKLPIFQEIIPKKIRKGAGEYFDIIQATASDGDWFIVLKTDAVCENDINMILAEAKRWKQKPQRCVLVSMSDLDENTRVKALQEKMWIWNENELNTLLNLYDKPYLVR